ncbi:hypothetical protein POTOM_016506 [Populus tomentosa]|uniref:non-specific serine/threonine protein kinase n=1 Tax=Populus tomentosa TaxID=118781 RepID=A0A8X8D913_POPTO|nr:hypothetical protein POTOM_016506 [Populus tomentosa]
MSLLLILALTRFPCSKWNSLHDKLQLLRQTTDSMDSSSLFISAVRVSGAIASAKEDLGDGRFGAIKRVMEDRGGSKKIFLDEVSILLRISHPNLARQLMKPRVLIGEQLLLPEDVPNKTLFDRIHTHHGQSPGILSWSSRLSIALDIARALDYLHSRADPTIIHRDVKSSSILLVDDDHAKLADSGLCKLGYDRPDSETSTAPSSPTSIRGSSGYIDINYLNTGLATPKIDVYSYGVLLLELITGLKSVQGSMTLAEWTEEWRKSDDVEVWANLQDPKLKGKANLEQLSVLSIPTCCRYKTLHAHTLLLFTALIVIS